MYIKHNGKKFNVSTTDAGNIRVNVRAKGRTGHIYKGMGLFENTIEASEKTGLSAETLRELLKGS